MSMLPYEEEEREELVVQRTDLQPADVRDSRTRWDKFIDVLRTTVGMKPLYLAERWALAKVRQEEADADARLLAARATYEQAMAEARRIELEAESHFEKSMAEAEYMRLRSDLIRSATNPLASELLAATTQDTTELLARLEDVMNRIELHGGTVEIDLPSDSSDEGESGS